MADQLTEEDLAVLDSFARSLADENSPAWLKWTRPLARDVAALAASARRAVVVLRNRGVPTAREEATLAKVEETQKRLTTLQGAAGSLVVAAKAVASPNFGTLPVDEREARWDALHAAREETAKALNG